MKIYTNTYLVICFCIVSVITVLLFTNNTLLGQTSKNLIPFGDLWLSLIVFIVTCFIGSYSIRITSRRIYFLSILTFGLLAVGVLIKLSLDNAFGAYYADYSNSGPARRLMYTSILTITTSLAGSALLVLALRPHSILEKLVTKYKFKYFVILVAIIATFLGAYFCLLLEASPYAENTVNLGAVLMPIVNVFYGALPPLDVHSQYGLYPYFMVPILKVVGLNVFNISLIFAILFFICFIGIFCFVYSLTGSSLIAFATMTAAFFLNTSFGNIWPGELYFQYRPIRMLAPCFALLLFLFYSSSPTALRRVFVLFCLSILVLWNVDSGIPTLAAFVIASSFNSFFTRKLCFGSKVKHSIYLILEGIFVLFAVFFIFIFILFIGRDEWATPAKLFEAQQRWRGELGYFSTWSQAIILPTVIYFVGVAVAVNRGLSAKWGRQEFGLLLVALLGLGIATYGTLNPHAAAITSYLMPVVLTQFAIIFAGPNSDISRTQLPRGYVIVPMFFCILPVSFLTVSFLFHIKDNYSYIGIPTIAEIFYASEMNEKSLWTIPGKTQAEVDYVRVKNLTGESPTVPPWVQKTNWIKSFPSLMRPPAHGRVFIASMHDHFLYAAIQQPSPIRIMNFQHISIYSEWSLLFNKIQIKQFEYVVIDQTYLLRNGDAAGPSSYDKFVQLVKNNYDKIAAEDIGHSWNYPLWKPSNISLWKARRT